MNYFVRLKTIAILLFLTFTCSYSVDVEASTEKTSCNCLKNKKVAVVLPMQHRAMDDIVHGLKSTVGKSGRFPEKYQDEKVIIFNGMGDTTNMYSIITQVAQNNEYGVIMPIGTSLTQMAMQITKEKPIISLASIIDEEERQNLIKEGHRNITNIQDEVPIENILSFVSRLELKNILLVYSNDDKIYEQVQKIEEIKNQYQFNIHKFPVMQSTDLYSISSAIKKNIDAILVLKDHLIVSSIGLLAQKAHEHNIPLIASDEGSVIGGADLAIGITEESIGIAGAKVLEKMIFDKKDIASIPVTMLSDIRVFLNEKSQVIQKENVGKNAGYELSLIK